VLRLLALLLLDLDLAAQTDELDLGERGRRVGRGSRVCQRAQGCEEAGRHQRR
jgi:hypothetical protein